MLGGLGGVGSRGGLAGVEGGGGLGSSAALSVLGRSAATPGSPADIAATANGQFLGMVGGTLAFAVPIFPNIATGRIAFGTGSVLTGTSDFQYDSSGLGPYLMVRPTNAGGGIATLAQFYNDSAIAGSGGKIALENAPGGTGDLVWQTRATSAGVTFAAGIDYSTLNYVLAAAGTLGSGADILQITAAGACTFIGATFDQAISSSGATVAAKVRNTSNTANAAAMSLVEVAGTTAADPFFQWSVAGTSTWTAGIDNSGAGNLVDPFKISRSSALGTEDFLSLADYLGYKLVCFGAESASGSFVTSGSPAAGWLGAAIYAASAATEQTALMLASRGGSAGSDVALEFTPAAGVGSGLANGSGGAKVACGYTATGDKYRLDWYTKKAGAYVQRMSVTGDGNVVLGSAALAAAATDGFLYIAGSPGTPTGAPTAFTGRAPLVVDTTNNKLYFYSGGAWRDAGP